MKCHICDSNLENPTYNRDFDDFDPCPRCLAIIADVFNDRPEDEMSDEEIEPTAEEMMADAEKLAYGGSFEA